MIRGGSAGRRWAANLSDLAAMAAKPLAAVISLALPRDGRGEPRRCELAIALYEGLLPLAEEFDVAIAGGDTNTYDGPLVISVTALGQATGRGPLTRSGGQPGDWLLVTGALGGSILGHMFDFTPRVREAMLLHERYELHAGIDISDGLALDASRLAAASGCGAVIFTDRVPISPDAIRACRARRRGRPASRRAAARAQRRPGLRAALRRAARTSPKQILRDQPLDCPITHVGELVAEPGLWQQDAGGERTPLEPIGWGHLDPLERGHAGSRITQQLMFTFIANNEHDTERLGAALAGVLPPGTVVGLIGTLGAGKTRLVQAVAAALGVPAGNVTSPTFVLVNEYRGGRLPIYHFDTYRLKDDDEFLDLGPEEYFDSSGLTFVEWADRVADLLPAKRATWKSRLRSHPAKRRRRITHLDGTSPQHEMSDCVEHARDPHACSR